MAPDNREGLRKLIDSLTELYESDMTIDTVYQQMYASTKDGDYADTIFRNITIVVTNNADECVELSHTVEKDGRQYDPLYDMYVDEFEDDPEAERLANEEWYRAVVEGYRNERLI